MKPTTGEVAYALRHSNVLRAGDVTDVSVIAHFDGYADAILRLHLSYSSEVEGAVPETLICKIYGPRWYSTSGIREVQLYRKYAPLVQGIPLPLYYGCLGDYNGRTLYLFIEDLTDRYEPPAIAKASRWIDQLTDILVSLHSHFWEHSLLESAEFFEPDGGNTRMPQALDPDGIKANESAARRALANFTAQHMTELGSDDPALLNTLVERWGDLFRKRVAKGRAV